MERIHTEQNRRPITSGKTQRHLALPLIQPEAHYGRDSDEGGHERQPGPTLPSLCPNIAPAAGKDDVAAGRSHDGGHAHA